MGTMVTKVKCPGCGQTLRAKYEPCEGVWICWNCYEDVDHLIEDVSTEDQIIQQGQIDPNWRG